MNRQVPSQQKCRDPAKASQARGAGMVLPGLKGKVAIVTGGAKNIGRAIVLQLARAGVRVAVFDLDLAGARKTAVEAAVLAGDGLACRVDMGEVAQIQAAVDRVARRFGRVDFLVNNAAKMDVGATTVADLTPARWDAMHQASLRGAFFCAQAVLPHLRRAGSGRIINMSSVVFAAGATGCIDYVAAKAGVVGLTRGLARELGPYRITVNAIAPGAVLTPRERRVATPAQVAAIVKLQCLEARVLPVDIANTVLFLASGLGTKLTGQTLHVDGGWIMH